VCSIYIDIRMPPQVRPVAIQHELRQVLNATGEAYDLELYRSLLGYEGKSVEPLVQSAEESYLHLFSRKIQPEVP
jgi:acetylornithine deacetylase/succinyl-diaminopimelate desuccinylase-like protein